MISWQELLTQPEPEGADYPRECRTLKCGLCGRFTRKLYLVWSSGPEPEPDYEVGGCCIKPGMRVQP